MNILPKKRWHVRTKENIARVRKDEAEAAEKEKARQDAIKLAESESRTELLRKKARQRTSTSDFISLIDSNPDKTVNREHINFFQEVEDGTAEYKKNNKEYEKEKKDEKEKYEKQIGYLTYLGQDTNEALGKQSWYEELPNYKKAKLNDNKEEGEVKMKQKSLEDPFVLMKKYTKQLETQESKIETVVRKSCDDFMRSSKTIDSKSRKLKRTGGKVHKKGRNFKSYDSKEKLKSKKRKRRLSSSSEPSSEFEQLAKERRLEMLRSERLNREKEERRRSNELLSKIHGGCNEVVDEVDKDRDKGPLWGGRIKQKYNSQFNPMLAKQNFT